MRYPGCRELIETAFEILRKALFPFVRTPLVEFRCKSSKNSEDFLLNLLSLRCWFKIK